MQVKTRFAPSPTGNLHIGSIRTALYSWLFARHNNGKFILRIEDTDLDRSKTICIDSILNGLKWLGLNWDEGPYFQTERLNRYKTVIDQMLEKGDAYICLCSLKKLEETRINQIKKGEKPRYIGTCRDLKLQKTCDQDYVIRFKNPSCGKVIFTDQIRGKIVFDNSELDDLIIQRSNGMPTYNFCVVIDDLDMQITHVIRGEDHINNTPRQINILKSLGAKIPFYAHLSMILDEEGHKISKRRNAINILEYRDSGFLPEAILNYIIRLGWSCGNKEIFNILEMQKLFNLQSITKSSSIINIKKLLWMNKYYINHLPINYITKIIKDYLNKKNLNIQNGPSIECVVKLLRNRYYTLNEIAESCKYFYSDFDVFNEKLTEKYLPLKNIFILKKLYQTIEQLSHWEQLSISKIINDVSLELKLNTKKINMILRVIITNNICSPSISSMLYLIGKEKTLFRIQKALNYLKKLH